jgi:hypothetical protein
MTGFPPKVTLCRLFEKTSARGTKYFQGRLGLAKIVLLKLPELSASGEPVWQLAIQELAAPPAEPTPKASAAAQALFQDPLTLQHNKETSRRRKVSSSRPRLMDHDPSPLPDDSLADLYRDDPPWERP